MEIPASAEDTGAEQDRERLTLNLKRVSGVRPVFERKVMDLLNIDIPEEEYIPVEKVKGGPVGKDELISNIEASEEIDAPVFVSSKDKKKEGSFIFIAGGPTLLRFLEEVRQRKGRGEFICTSNLTHDYLIDKGIIPDACLIIDPKERVKDYIKKPHKDVTYYIGTVCNPKVAQNLLDAGMNVVKLLVAYGEDEGLDIDRQQDIYGKEYKDYLVGGTMAGLRAMPFAILMGYKKIEYYGFDSCFSSKEPTLVYEKDPEFEEWAKKIGHFYKDSQTGERYVMKEHAGGGYFYAYDKNRSEHIQVCKTPDGRKFVTSPVFSHQAMQLIKWWERLEGVLDIEIHGDSLSSHYLNFHKNAMIKISEQIGVRRWTNKYKDMQLELHATGEYGVDGQNIDIEPLMRQICSLYARLNRPITILDYGCGDGTLKDTLEGIFNIVTVTNYDPFIEKYAKEPEGKFDYVICLDVMEHVEKQCVKNVLYHIRTLCEHMATFQIANVDSKKTLSDGRNAHITQKQPAWWIDELVDFFIIGEAAASVLRSYYICMPLGIDKDNPMQAIINDGIMARYKGHGRQNVKTGVK